jgi:hypothetical protein
MPCAKNIGQLLKLRQLQQDDNLLLRIKQQRKSGIQSVGQLLRTTVLLTRQLHSMFGARLFQSVLMNDATMRAAPVEMNLVHRYLCAFELRRLC